MAKTGRDSFQVRLRMPEPLYDLLVAEAHNSGRSISAEIVNRLEQSLDARRSIPHEISRAIDQLVEAEVKARMQRLIAKISAEEPLS